MLDLFSVITNGGLVLWYFQDPAQALQCSVDAVNDLFWNVHLQERGGRMDVYESRNVAVKRAVNNEFQLLFVACYQKILKLSYVDKFLDDIQRRFTETYHDQLKHRKFGESFEFSAEYQAALRSAEEGALELEVARPRLFCESEKSRKTVDSMVERTTLFGGPGAQEQAKKKKKKKKKNKKSKGASTITFMEEQEEEVDFEGEEDDEVVNGECNNNVTSNDEDTQDEGMLLSDGITGGTTTEGVPTSSSEGGADSREGSVCGSEGSGGQPAFAASPPPPTLMMRNRHAMFKGATNKKNVAKAAKAAKKGKEKRVWELDNTDASCLDYSQKAPAATNTAAKPPTTNGTAARPDYLPPAEQVGTLRGALRNMEAPAPKEGGWYSHFSSLLGGGTVTEAAVAPCLEKLRDHLIAKNVAAEIAGSLCASVQDKLLGTTLGTFEAVSGVVKTALTDALVTLLTPKRRLDILRDVVEAKSKGRPYVMTFAGVNGVGKSTNLAKVCFWLLENGFRVMIAACDTFRAGAVEQLRTHCRHLAALHPNEEQPNVKLYEQGYGKDAAEIARMAIETGRKEGFDVVLVDTAGRMQDNEPLMRALAKLITVNRPELTLFVGEALVGNEAVDQLTKFSRALANHCPTNVIDGILLTKFDTIDDKVGAAISMAYITGQPIVFVGCGQTYADLKALDAKAVVGMLMR